MCDIYELYPSKCPIKNSSTGKCSKDKIRILTLLKTKSKDEIMSIIKIYVNECTTSKTYIKNFSTFLNNIPDYSEQKQTQQLNKSRFVHYRMMGREQTHHEKAYLENLQLLGSEHVQFLNYVENGN